MANESQGEATTAPAPARRWSAGSAGHFYELPDHLVGRIKVGVQQIEGLGSSWEVPGLA